MTREQIEQQLRLDNPTTTDDAGNRHGPGSEVYDAAIHRWADAIENAVKPPLAEAENYQVRAWMIRGGLDPDLVPTIIAQVVPDGPERKEALMRWDYAVRVPRDFPLVDKIGEKMGLTPEQIDAAWPAILEL
jgi:hypothetical protein